ncbi:MAG TPA: Uma2 family endonuclease [Thermoanaerobaculia bacterium]|nr:Uma2 family endonuclease [Thermoanaerobaculia bacterium]
MALADLRRKLTYEDYVHFPDDGKRHEIMDGEHYVSPAPLLRHQRISMRLTVRLMPFIEQNGFGELFAAPADVLLSLHDVLQPDLFYVSTQRARIVTEQNVQGAPDLVIEIFSPSTRRVDEGIKLDRYDLLGVEEYWMLNPVLNTAKIYRRDGNRLVLVAELSAVAGDVFTTPLLPGLEIPLAEIFA